MAQEGGGGRAWRIQGTLRLADTYRNLKRFADAVPEYQAATRIKPKEPEPWASLTNCYFQLSQWTDVISAGEQALKLKSDQPHVHYLLSGAHNELGVASYTQKRYPEAITHFKEAIRLTPNDPASHDNLATWHNNLANAYLAIGDRDSAMAEYNILRGLDSAKAAELLKDINPQQSAAQPTPEPAPTYEYFRLRVIKSETEGFTRTGRYRYTGTNMTNLNTGRQCELRCWQAPGGPACQTMRAGDTYNARSYYISGTTTRTAEIQIRVNGADVWVGVIGCDKD